MVLEASDATRDRRSAGPPRRGGRVPRYGPLEVKRFDGCEVAVIDLVADVVLANPVDDYGFTPNVADAETYWLHLDTGKLDVWTADSLTELEP